MESGLVKMPYAIWTNMHPDEYYEVFYKDDVVKFTFREKDVLLEDVDVEQNDRFWNIKIDCFELDFRQNIIK